MADEIEEYITSDEYQLTCKIPGCGWVVRGEITENFSEEIEEDWTGHLKNVHNLVEE